MFDCKVLRWEGVRSVDGGGTRAVGRDEVTALDHEIFHLGGGCERGELGERKEPSKRSGNSRKSK